MTRDPAEDRSGYEPPEICDIESADDREFAVVPGDGGGSPTGPSN